MRVVNGGRKRGRGGGGGEGGTRRGGGGPSSLLLLCKGASCFAGPGSGPIKTLQPRNECKK